MQKTLQKVNMRYKVGFGAAFVIGLLAHIMVFVNKYSFHDDMGQLFGAGSTISSGRWMLGILYVLEQQFYGTTAMSIPVINGIVSIVCIGISACLIIYLLDLKRLPVCMCIGGIMVSFPVICGTFGFMFTAHYYMLGYLMGIAGTVLVCRSGKWYLWLLGTILQACSVGVYQATIPTILSAIVLWVLSRCWDNELDWPAFWKTCLRLVVNCVCFMALYFIINELFLVVSDKELNDHRGISEVGAVSIGTYLSRILVAFQRFFLPATEGSANIFPFRLRVLYWLTLLFLSLSVVLKAVQLRINKGLQLILPMLVLPLAVNFIYVMSEDACSLTLYGQVSILILLAFLADRLKIRTLRIAGTAMLMVFILMFVRLDNSLYLKAEFEQTRTIQYYTAMVAQIKSADGYLDDMPVAFVGANNNKDSTVKDIAQFDVLEIRPYKGIESLVNDYQVITFIERWCGFSPQYADAKKFAELPEVVQMSCYPDDGSIQVIDGTVVIKIG